MKGVRQVMFKKVVLDVLNTHPDSYWRIRETDYWHFVEPSRHRHRLQGWKIHVSATPDTAADILGKVSSVLVPLGVAFKFVGTPDLLHDSLSRGSDPAASGKFITVYPNDDGQFRDLLDKLHTPLTDHWGPRIMSDRQYQGGIVHYRYGGISQMTRLDDKGAVEEMIVSPDGSLVEDRRVAWFSPPSWLSDPVEQPAADAGSTKKSKSLLLADRYQVTGAIRHTNRGGVFRALDTKTDRRVVIKQSRAGIDPSSDGADARDLLRGEAAMLRRLADVAVVPELVDLFDLADQTFLVEEELAGRPLQDLVTPDEDDAPPPSDAIVLNLARQIVKTLQAVHDAGIVVGDLSPGNFLMGPDGRLQLLDLESAAEVGAPIPKLRTPGYAAPEKLESERDDVLLATPEMDRYGAGALIAALCLQRRPVTRPSGLDTGSKTSSPMDVMAADNPLIHALNPLVHGLMAFAPEDRWTWSRAERELHAAARVHPSMSTAGTPAEPDPDQLIRESLLNMISALRPQAAALVPTLGTMRRLDPRFVQAGAAGVTGVLLQAARCPAVINGGDRDLDDVLQDALVTLSRWWDRNLGRPTVTLLPGLYNGHAGMIWAAADVAQAVGDSVTLDHALEIAEQLPTRWHIPTVAHGIAGTGATMLHLWRTTGRWEFRQKALECAEHLVDTAVRKGSVGVRWMAEQNTPTAHNGIATGTAGIGRFLLSAAQILQEPRFAEVAQLAGDELVAQARLRDVDVLENGRARTYRAAWWSDQTDDGRTPHGWWGGPAGIGAFLWSLGADSNRLAYRDTAAAAAAAVRYSAPRAPLGAWWGLAGDGHFLLDIAGDEGPTSAAGRWAGLVTALLTSHATSGRQGLTLYDKRAVEWDFATGVPGVLSFLLRAHHGAAAPWMTPEPGLAPQVP
ncbi:hypothetical protein DN051_01325 [Streptomyces cadmiisoli]|uniref:Protein kinase domain-containing protein n=2 Tax=Streptomyces cadmiisoli TaxID=2184053 RepID=A0A2Z4IQP5_9ACTN|nr:hypothetical protein DN051_01325 [Streptomyces cadmiisoli]